MEEWPAYEREWMAKVSNKGPPLYRRRVFVSDLEGLFAGSEHLFPARRLCRQ